MCQSAETQGDGPPLGKKLAPTVLASEFEPGIAVDLCHKSVNLGGWIAREERSDGNTQYRATKAVGP